jgi:phosphoribosyl 1,2-cyclic phosphate phosphodiesterase
MRLFFLGTAAAEAYPAMFCECPNCERARSLGGRNLRLRSCLLVNEDLLLDAGPDLAAAAQRHGVRLSRLALLLLTHGHADHLYAHSLTWRAAENRRAPLRPLTVYGSPRVIGRLSAELGTEMESMELELKAVSPYQTWQDGAYRLWSYPAHHGPESSGALIYGIGDGRHSLLYATDTGPWPEEVWQALAGRRFDAVVLEETMGPELDREHDHHDFESFPQTFRRFQRDGLLAPGTPFIAHHISHTNPPHDELVSRFAPEGITVAYDGLQIEL